jgi:hypothetical protein
MRVKARNRCVKIPIVAPDMGDDVPPPPISSPLNSKAYTIVGLTLVLDPIDRRGSSA